MRNKFWIAFDFPPNGNSCCSHTFPKRIVQSGFLSIHVNVVSIPSHLSIPRLWWHLRRLQSSDIQLWSWLTDHHQDKSASHHGIIHTQGQQSGHQGRYGSTVAKKISRRMALFVAMDPIGNSTVSQHVSCIQIELVREHFIIYKMGLRSKVTSIFVTKIIIVLGDQNLTGSNHPE